MVVDDLAVGPVHVHPVDRLIANIGEVQLVADIVIVQGHDQVKFLGNTAVVGRVDFGAQPTYVVSVGKDKERFSSLR